MPSFASTSRVIRWPVRIAGISAAGVGISALGLGAMLAMPVRTPPELASISSTARALDRSNLPELLRFPARDGTSLAYRAYAPAGGVTEHVAILIHGSSGNGTAMNVMGRALAAAGITAIVPDMRGHGFSGTRGDIAYLGQLDDDLADLVAHARTTYPKQPFSLVGHSSGGGFALRIASGPLGETFDRYVLMAPFLGPFSPATRPSTGSARWAEPDVPRILALTALQRMGAVCCESLTVLAFATAPGAELRQTTRYSFRLMVNFGTGFDAASLFAKVRRPLTVIAGARDELMDAARYAEFVEAPGRAAKSIVIPDVDHMTVIADPRALASIIEEIKQ